MNAAQNCADDLTLFSGSAFRGAFHNGIKFALIKKGGTVWMPLENVTDSWDLISVAVLE